MKQLFLKSLLWTIQTTTKGIASTIRVINTRPAQLFWTPLFAYGAISLILQGFGWNLIPAALLTYWAIRSATKLLTRSAPTEAAGRIPTLTDFYQAIDDRDLDAAHSAIQSVEQNYAPDIVKAAHSRLKELRQVRATEARDQAVTELSAEAQAVVDRIQERTVRLIPNDPPATIKVKAPRKPRATKIIEVDGVPTIVPARPRKPKGGDQ